MGAAVVANNITFPSLGAAVDYLHGQLGVTSFEYTPTVMGPAAVPDDNQIMALVSQAMFDLNPEDPVNRILFDRIVKGSAMQAASFASELARHAQANPTNVAYEGTKVWELAIAPEGTLEAKEEPPLVIPPGRDEEE